MLEKHGIIFTETEHTDNNKTNILIGQYSGEIISDYANENGINLQVFDAGENKFDEHILEINNNSNNGDIVIIGNGKGSEYYAIATLDQINIKVIGNCVSISGTDSKAAIYTLEGVCIYNGNDRDIVISAPGIYILNIEKHSQYIYIK